MTRFLIFVAAAVALCSVPAAAEERLIGKIVSVAGADTTNGTTATPFRVPLGSKITMWCDAAAYIHIGSTAAATATGNGLPVAASEKFPSSVFSGGPRIAISGQVEPSGIVRIFGAGAVTCYVYTRFGTE